MQNTLSKLLAASTVVLVSSCATPPDTTTPHLDRHFGQAVNMAKAQQTLNPDASRNTDPVTGMSGKEGNLVIDAYHDTLKAPPPPATVISIGGGISGGSGGSGGQ